jgi:hypothetical protein
MRFLSLCYVLIARQIGIIVKFRYKLLLGSTAAFNIFLFLQMLQHFTTIFFLISIKLIINSQVHNKWTFFYKISNSAKTSMLYRALQSLC